MSSVLPPDGTKLAIACWSPELSSWWQPPPASAAPPRTWCPRHRIHGGRQGLRSLAAQFVLHFSISRDLPSSAPRFSVLRPRVVVVVVQGARRAPRVRADGGRGRRSLAWGTQAPRGIGGPRGDGSRVTFRAGRFACLLCSPCAQVGREASTSRRNSFHRMRGDFCRPLSGSLSLRVSC